MDYLSRDSAPFSEEFWGRIDDTIVDSASRILIGRRFLTLYGPLGAGAQSINIDSAKKAENFADGIVTTGGRPVSYTHLDVYKRQLPASLP